MSQTIKKNASVIEIVRNIENGRRQEAAEQINGHDEPARMAIAVLSTLCDHTGYRQVTGDQFREAVQTVIRTLNAGDLADGSWG